MRRFTFLLSIILFGLLFGFGDAAQSQSLDSLIVYVWDFTSRDGQKNDLTDNLTEEFEEALINVNRILLLERRKYDRLLAHKANEKAVLDIEKIDTATLDSLKFYQANAIVFGEVHDDIKSGEIKVTTTFQAFYGKMLIKKSIRFTRGKQDDAESREKAMEKLIKKIFPAKEEDDKQGSIVPFEEEQIGVLVCDFFNNKGEFDENGSIWASRAMNELQLLTRPDLTLKGFFVVQRVYATDHPIKSEAQADDLGKKYKADVVIFGERFCDDSGKLCTYPKAKIRHSATAKSMIHGNMELARVADANLPSLISAETDQLIKFIIGWTYLNDNRRTQYQKAIKYLESAADTTTAREESLYDIRLHLCNAYWHAGKYDFALKMIPLVEKAAIRKDDRQRLSWCYSEYGLCYQSKGDWDKALEYYQKSLAIRIEVGDRAGLGPTYNNIGGVYDSKGDWDKALEYYHKSLAIGIEVGDLVGSAYTLNNIATLYYQQKNMEKRKKTLKKLLRFSLQQEICIILLLSIKTLFLLR